RVRLDDGPSVAELGGVLDVCRDASDILEHVFADKAAVPGRSAPQDDHALDLTKLLVHPCEATELDHPLLLEESAPHRFAERLGLLHDLLEHEVRITATLHLTQVPVDTVDRSIHRTDATAMDRVA